MEPELSDGLHAVFTLNLHTALLIFHPDSSLYAPQTLNVSLVLSRHFFVFVHDVDNFTFILIR